MSEKRVAILLSGGGTNMAALVDSMTGDHPARPVLVVSNKPGAGGLEKAAARGVPRHNDGEQIRPSLRQTGMNCGGDLFLARMRTGGEPDRSSGHRRRECIQCRALEW